MLRTIIRRLVFSLVRLFYPRIRIVGEENIPPDGAMVVANHPNGLLDPAILMVALDRPVHFLAMSLLFGNPFGKYIMETFFALPIFRPADDGKRGGPTGDAPERNEKTFAACRMRLNQGRIVALFPEGKTHDEPSLLPLRTGSARIALSAAKEYGWAKAAPIVPVGIWYHQKTIFRSTVVLVVGKPIPISTFETAYKDDERASVRELTQQIEDGLDLVVFQAEDSEVLRMLPSAARWLAPNDVRGNSDKHHAWATRVLNAYNIMRERRPAELQELVNQLFAYVDELETIGISDPWSLEDSYHERRRLARAIFWIVIGAPFALIGGLISYIPYRLARPTSRWVVVYEDTTQISTIKLLSGALYVLLFWMVAACVVGYFLGPLFGLATILLAPILAFVALRWTEVATALSHTLRRGLLRFTKPSSIDALVEQRQALAQQVYEAVIEIEAENNGQSIAA